MRRDMVSGVQTCALPLVKPDRQISRIRLSHGVFTCGIHQGKGAEALLHWLGVHAELRSLGAETFCRGWIAPPISSLPAWVGVPMPRPLRSTGITPLPRYYGPLRLLPQSAGTVMGSLSTFSPALARTGPPRRPPVFPDLPRSYAHPSHPQCPP